MSTATLETPAAHAARRNRPFAWVEQSLTLAWRNIVRIRQNPEALADVTLQPIIFLVLFLFVFGGAVAQGGPGVTTCRSCCPACSSRRWSSRRWAPASR